MRCVHILWQWCGMCCYFRLARIPTLPYPRRYVLLTVACRKKLYVFFYLIGHNKSLFVCFGREEEKGLQRAQSSVEAIIKRSDSDDSLVEYGEGGEIPFNEDGSFIGQYTGTRRDVRELDFGGSLELHPPMNTIYSLA